MDHSRNMVMRGATRMSLSAHMRAVISKHNNYSLQAIRLIVGMHTQQPDISNSRVMLVHIITKFLHIFPWLYTPLLGARHCHPSATFFDSRLPNCLVMSTKQQTGGISFHITAIFAWQVSQYSLMIT